MVDPPSTQEPNLAQAQAQDLLSEGFRAAETSTVYQDARHGLLDSEQQLSWYAGARSRASQLENRAQQILLAIRESERDDPELFGNMPSELIPDSNTRDMGGRFLINKPRIDQSKIFAMAQRMPKGCHLHIHFNCELPPEELLPRAASSSMQPFMCIRTTKPLMRPQDYADVEVVFSVIPKTTVKVDCFATSYNPDFKDKNNSPWMLWSDFRQRFHELAPADLGLEERPDGLDEAECWVREKMILTAHDVYGEGQTVNSAWACFNQGTRAFKGLVNYKSVYRWYVGAAIDSMIRDNVMYAELRPMLMDKSIPSDDGTLQIDLNAQMKIICEEVRKKQQQLQDAGKPDQFPFGLKIIYCTPRSIPRPKMQSELLDCLKLKLEFPDLICGFDLVGAEDRRNPISFYADLLVGFTETCKKLKISIPFMFHAGETLLDAGGTANPDNSNLYDALLLNCKRIGHGYALLKHPMLIEKYKQQNIALELCPVSNELLHLCGNAREHPFPALLAAGLHCTLNADNPGLYRGATHDSSSLSYEFYQVMVGDTRMNIHGWKQLAEWSIQHSCLAEAEIDRAMNIFAKDWDAFCHWVVSTYGQYADGLTKPDLSVVC
ncbi:hypothetical protein LTS14_009306 [Recurvomyces mirabilis]|uniref:uncharacterized protein n=1 Tax=Recurvomyces mirabilis TaxID=574656 RepID=UPI002DDE7CA8|nr:hypothetical protein LTS14_009306 [Recurvomyces mirabilis]